MSVHSTLDRNFEPLNLDRLKDLFRDESGYEQFVEVIASSFRSATCPVFAGGKIIGVVLSPENAKDLLFDRVVERWSKDPSILDRLGKALADDDLIPADDLDDAPESHWHWRATLAKLRASLRYDVE